VITVQNLTRRFGRLTAVDDISFTVEKGEVVGFLGPNGAGKSTTMRILAGFLPATSGAAEVAGFDVLRQSMEVRRRIGYLPESVPLYGEHRVREMLDFQGRLHGMSSADRKARIPQVLERVGVLDRAEQLVGNLSRGLRQRVGLAVALLPDPEVLILDEPTSGLDPLQRLEIRSLLKELAADHTVLLSSHILPEVEAVCPRVIMIHKGRIAAQGTQAEILKSVGRGAHVRLEAVVPDVAEALRLLSATPGVSHVMEGGRLGIHHVFEVFSDEDVREDVGALAAVKQWALRELSWSQPSLEELFARVALELCEGEIGEPARSANPSAQGAAVSGSFGLEMHPGGDAPVAPEPAPRPAQFLSPFETGPKPAAPPASDAPAALGTPGKPAQPFVLNPFEGAPGRDLSKPTKREDAE
jgi:ABC-2 type transport system ATP-binding protein